MVCVGGYLVGLVVLSCFCFYLPKQIAAEGKTEPPDNGAEQLNESSGRSSKSRAAMAVHYPPATRAPGTDGTKQRPPQRPFHLLLAEN